MGIDHRYSQLGFVRFLQHKHPKMSMKHTFMIEFPVFYHLQIAFRSYVSGQSYVLFVAKPFRLLNI